MFTLSGKKKFLVTVVGILSMVAAARFGAYAHVIAFIGLTVGAYLTAETAVDRQRVLGTMVSTIVYNLEKFQSLPAAITAPLEEAGVQITAK